MTLTDDGPGEGRCPASRAREEELPVTWEPLAAEEQSCCATDSVPEAAPAAAKPAGKTREPDVPPRPVLPRPGRPRALARRGELRRQNCSLGAGDGKCWLGDRENRVSRSDKSVELRGGVLQKALWSPFESTPCPPPSFCFPTCQSGHCRSLEKQWEGSWGRTQVRFADLPWRPHERGGRGRVAKMLSPLFSPLDVTCHVRSPQCTLGTQKESINTCGLRNSPCK